MQYWYAYALSMLREEWIFFELNSHDEIYDDDGPRWAFWS